MFARKKCGRDSPGFSRLSESGRHVTPTSPTRRQGRGRNPVTDADDISEHFPILVGNLGALRVSLPCGCTRTEIRWPQDLGALEKRRAEDCARLTSRQTGHKGAGGAWMTEVRGAESPETILTPETPCSSGAISFSTSGRWISNARKPPSISMT